MSIKTLSIAAIAASLLVGPALAETTYYGTTTHQPTSREQNNAQSGPVAAERTARTGEGFAARQTFGAPVSGTPNYGASSDAARENNADVYLGTAWRYQDTADHVTR